MLIIACIHVFTLLVFKIIGLFNASAYALLR